MTEIHEGKYLYAAVKVGERGQIVIPKDARKHFNIKAGDDLIVVGDIKKGIAITTIKIMKELERSHPRKEESENGKYDYGTVKCGESFQIVIPKMAREHFGIEAGDKLLVLGDITKGIAIQKASIMKNLALTILSGIGSTLLGKKSE